ncbi:hypothetical protein DFH06DRAFT_644075 [Mycena polygramma]|nr:hypothetical protein DFH06DRAFT_644075 [Mycena polygramma]
MFTRVSRKRRETNRRYRWAVRMRDGTLTEATANATASPTGSPGSSSKARARIDCLGLEATATDLRCSSSVEEGARMDHSAMAKAALPTTPGPILFVLFSGAEASGVSVVKLGRFPDLMAKPVLPATLDLPSVLFSGAEASGAAGVKPGRWRDLQALGVGAFRDSAQLRATAYVRYGRSEFATRGRRTRNVDSRCAWGRTVFRAI